MIYLSWHWCNWLIAQNSRFIAVCSIFDEYLARRFTVILQNRLKILGSYSPVQPALVS